MATPPVSTFRLNSLSGLELHNVEAKLVTYRGRQAVRLVEQDEPTIAIAILSQSDSKMVSSKLRLPGLRARMLSRRCAASSASPFACS
jgi:hypothetical protein